MSKNKGYRYDKRNWEPVVRKMFEAGALYGDIAKKLGTSHTTITRYVWSLGLAKHAVHRHTVRSNIIKAKKEVSKRVEA